MKSAAVKVSHLTSLHSWAPFHDRIELSSIFLVTLGIGEFVLAHRGLPGAAAMLKMPVSAAGLAILWGWAPSQDVPTCLRWLAAFLLWSVVAEHVSGQMHLWLEILYSVPAPTTDMEVMP